MNAHTRKLSTQFDVDLDTTGTNHLSVLERAVVLALCKGGQGSEICKRLALSELSFNLVKKTLRERFQAENDFHLLVLLIQSGAFSLEDV